MKSDSPIYLYLGRRDKGGIRNLALFSGRETMATRIEDTSAIVLPSGWSGELDQLIYDSRMLWEPWLESAATYEELRSAVKSRGYTNVPLNYQPELPGANAETPVVNLTHLPKKSKMLRKA